MMNRYVFGYGSLMSAASLMQTVPGAIIRGSGSLSGYRRMFNVQSSYRKNESSCVYACVLDAIPDVRYVIAGVVVELSPEAFDVLVMREGAYAAHKVVLIGGIEAYAFFARDHADYHYIFNDTVQDAYLRECVKGARALGILDNFVDTTFIENKPLREIPQLVTLLS